MNRKSSPRATLYDEKALLTPFVKWAGGKRQLRKEIGKRLPHYQSSFTYVEPFVGGGAVLFYILNNYEIGKVKKVIINDLNERLIQTYRHIKDNVDDLIGILKDYEDNFFNSKSKSCGHYDKPQLSETPCGECQNCFYYTHRSKFNDTSRKSSPIVKSALFIFLNKTCFNGLFRVNSNDEFNVPIGSFNTQPTICNEKNLRAISEQFQEIDIKIHLGDYASTLQYAGPDVFFYIDPPYVPLEKDSFVDYTSETFGDNEQEELRDFCRELKSRGADFLASNSNHQKIRKWYKDYKIDKVAATRAISSDKKNRGCAYIEVLISGQEIYKNRVVRRRK